MRKPCGPLGRSGPAGGTDGSFSLGAVQAKDAATVMLVRDSDRHGGLEVFMLRRNLRSEFVGGLYLFPGGAVDPADRLPELAGACRGRTDGEASALLGVSEGGLGFWVAAVRECFEEAGVLLAYPGSGTTGEQDLAAAGERFVSFDGPGRQRRFGEHRHSLDSGRLGMLDLCRQERLVLATDRIHFFSHWITPLGAPRRYDTRFFVAPAPPSQVPLHDDREAIASVWRRPADALEQCRSGEMEMIHPTIRNLEEIGRFDTASDLLAAAAAAEADAAAFPRLAPDTRGGHGVRIPFPGEAAPEPEAPVEWRGRGGRG